MPGHSGYPIHMYWMNEWMLKKTNSPRDCSSPGMRICTGLHKERYAHVWEKYGYWVAIPSSIPTFFFFFSKRTLCMGQQSACVNTPHPSSGSQMKRRDSFFRLLIDSKKKIVQILVQILCFFFFSTMYFYCYYASLRLS